MSGLLLQSAPITAKSRELYDKICRGAYKTRLRVAKAWRRVMRARRVPIGVVEAVEADGMVWVRLYDNRGAGP